MSPRDQRVSPRDLAIYRLERKAALLSPVEAQAFWAGVLAALRLADVLDEGHTADLLEWAKGKVAS